MRKKRRKRRKPKRVLRLPDLALAKAAVLNSLSSESAKRSYEHTINEFVDWYCSEPRLAFNRVVVLRYRMYLEQLQYASSTINLRLAAVRRLAYEAADSGLLSPELAAGIRRVKGVRRLGVRLGNWLSADQAKRLLGDPAPNTLRGKRDHAMLGGRRVDRGRIPFEEGQSVTASEQNHNGRWGVAGLNGLSFQVDDKARK